MFCQVLGTRKTKLLRDTQTSSISRFCAIPWWRITRLWSHSRYRSAAIPVRNSSVGHSYTKWRILPPTKESYIWGAIILFHHCTHKGPRPCWYNPKPLDSFHTELGQRDCNLQLTLKYREHFCRGQHARTVEIQWPSAAMCRRLTFLASLLNKRVFLLSPSTELEEVRVYHSWQINVSHDRMGHWQIGICSCLQQCPGLWELVLVELCPGGTSNIPINKATKCCI